MPWFSTWAKHACTLDTFTPGAGICEPSLKIARINRTNRSLRRRSGVRNALAKAPSTWSSFYTCGISLGCKRDPGSLTGTLPGV